MLLINYKFLNQYKSHVSIFGIIIVFDLYRFLESKFANSSVYCLQLSNNRFDFSFFDSGDSGILVANNNLHKIPSVAVFRLYAYSIFDTLPSYEIYGMSSSFTRYLLGYDVLFDCRAMCISFAPKLSVINLCFKKSNVDKFEFSILFFNSLKFDSYYEVRFQYLSSASVLDIYLLSIGVEENILEKVSFDFYDEGFVINLSNDSDIALSLNGSSLFPDFDISNQCNFGYKINSDGIIFW